MWLLVEIIMLPMIFERTPNHLNTPSYKYYDWHWGLNCWWTNYIVDPETKILVKWLYSI